MLQGKLFRRGHTVHIRTDLMSAGRYNNINARLRIFCSDTMASYRGSVQTIRNERPDTTYKLIDDPEWYWVDDMFAEGHRISQFVVLANF